MAKAKTTKGKARSKATQEVTEDNQEVPSSSRQSKPIGTTSTRSGTLQEVETVCFNCRYFQPGLGGPICVNPEAAEYQQRVGDNHRGDDFVPKADMRTSSARGASPRSRKSVVEEEGLYTPEPVHPDEATDDTADVRGK